MVEITIDTEGIYGDVETQVREMKTDELLQMYDFFRRNPSLFVSVSDELLHRREHRSGLQYEGQVEKIDERLGSE